MAATLVVNADDLGLSRGATLGVIRAHREGVVTSASLVPTGADYRHAVDRCRAECPDLGLGLHFTLSAGRPVSPTERVPLLVDDRGYMRFEFGSLFGRAGLRRRQDLLEQIGIELEAQLQRLLADGVKPDHIDSERHVHLIPAIFEKVAALAVRRRIPFVRMGREIGWRMLRLRHFDPAVLRGGIVKSTLLAALTRRNRPAASNVRASDNFASYLLSGRLDLLLPEILGAPPDGVTEIMVHPGIPEESRGVRLGNPGLEHYLGREDRRRELNACIRARELASGTKLCTFGALAAMGERGG
jgi:predicted glycoside hydrolase/deacetylase ChbG (UPF0249 family)